MPAGVKLQQTCIPIFFNTQLHFLSINLRRLKLKIDEFKNEQLDDAFLLKADFFLLYSSNFLGNSIFVNKIK